MHVSIPGDIVLSGIFLNDVFHSEKLEPFIAPPTFMGDSVHIDT